MKTVMLVDFAMFILTIIRLRNLLKLYESTNLLWCPNVFTELKITKDVYNEIIKSKSTIDPPKFNYYDPDDTWVYLFHLMGKIFNNEKPTDRTPWNLTGTYFSHFQGFVALIMKDRECTTMWPFNRSQFCPSKSLGPAVSQNSSFTI